jgi:hypothetical protein
MVWRPVRGAWRPIVRRASGEWQPERVLELLDEALSTPADFRAFTLCPKPDADPVSWAGKLRLPREDYRSFALAAREATAPGHRYLADFAAAWASDACTLGGGVQDTSFQFTAGQQRFLAMVRQLVEETNRDDLRRSLFEPWRYEDSGPSLRWDPLDESRQYALQWYDPTNSSRNPLMAMRGANRLAVEALPFFPSVPLPGVWGEARLRTKGFSRFERREYFTWPIWSGWLTADVVASLLSHPELSKREPDRKQLSPMGVEEVFRSAVVMPSGRYRSFAPAQAL